MEDRRDRLYDELAVVGKAFGSAKRLQLVELLAQTERGVEELAQAAGMGLSTVSAHLQVLRSSNLVATRREGTKIIYRLAGDDVVALCAAMREVARTRSADVARALDSYFGLPGEPAVDAVTRADLADRLGAEDLVLLDVRPHKEYAAGHIPGARSTPLETLAELAPGLADGSPVVTYCRGSYCVMAHDAVRILGSHSVAASRLEDGMLEWRSHGLPVEVGE